MALHGTTKIVNVGSYVSVGCLLVVLLTVIILVWSMPDIKTVDGNTHICVHEGGSLRCTETVTTLSRILDMEVKRVYDKTKNEDAVETKAYFENNVQIELKNDYLAAIPEMKPASKVVGQLSKPQPGPQRKEMESVSAWFHDKDLDYTTGFMRYGVRYQNGRLIVPLTGTYNIYSFVSLTENDDSRRPHSVKSTNRTLVKHAMYKYNIRRGEEVELASSVSTHRKSNNQNFNAFSSHISTLVQLEAGDEISVKISDIFLTSYPGDNFFGLHMI